LVSNFTCGQKIEVKFGRRLLAEVADGEEDAHRIGASKRGGQISLCEIWISGLPGDSGVGESVQGVGDGFVVFRVHGTILFTGMVTKPHGQKLSRWKKCCGGYE
jgi:hypothetical protein